MKNSAELSDLEEVILIDEPLEVDQEELDIAEQERGKLLDLSNDLTVRARQNRLCLLRKRATRQRSSHDRVSIETVFQFQGLPHADCRFTEITLAIRLTNPGDARITGINPQSALIHTSKVTQKVSPSFEASFPGVNIKASLGAETENEQVFTKPVLVGYTDERFANWTFRTPSDLYELDLNVLLTLTVVYPESAPVLDASFSVSASVMVMNSWIPMRWGKASTQQNFVRRLDR